MAKSTVAVKFTGDTKELKGAIGDAEGQLQGFGARVGSKLRVGMTGAGLAAGAALTDAFFKALDREEVTAEAQVALGLTEEEAARLGEVSGDVYAAAWGDSFQEVSDAAASLVSNLEGQISDVRLEDLTTKALAFAQVFRVDSAEAIKTVGFLLRNNLVDSAEEAFDVLVAGLQKIPREMQGEALEALNEYAVNFQALGFDAEQALALIVSAAQNTSVGVDKVGDAVKEFLIRATDGSTATVAALESLDLPAKQIADELLAGGETAEAAFGKIIEGLLAIESPSLQAQTAIALFGTPIEDLSVDQIPAFLSALQEAEGGLGDFTGAADEAVNNLDTNASKIETWKRRVETALVDFVAEDAIPAIEDLGQNWKNLTTDVGVTTDVLIEEVLTPFGVWFKDWALGIDDTAVSIGASIANAFNFEFPDLTNLPVIGDTLRGIGDLTGIGFGGESDFQFPTTTPTRPAPTRDTRRDPRAHGGPVYPGQEYIVGEQGPEVFSPRTAGQIIPNGAGRQVVNNITIYNPQGVPTEESIGRELRRLQLMAI